MKFTIKAAPFGAALLNVLPHAGTGDTLPVPTDRRGGRVTSVFVTFEMMADRVMVDALKVRGVLLSGHGAGAAELYQGAVDDTPDAVDAWFTDLPWSSDDTATLVAYGRGVSVTTVVIDGELASTTRADADGVDVDDWLEDAA